MGNVALILRIMPESPDVDILALKADIQKKVPQVRDIQEDPIGFGLKALKLAVIVSDAQGESDAIEKTLSEIPGVERAEIIELTLT